MGYLELFTFKIYCYVTFGIVSFKEFANFVHVVEFIDMKLFIIFAYCSVNVFRIYGEVPSFIVDIDNLCPPYFFLACLLADLSPLLIFLNYSFSVHPFFSIWLFSVSLNFIIFVLSFLKFSLDLICSYRRNLNRWFLDLSLC